MTAPPGSQTAHSTDEETNAGRSDAAVSRRGYLATAGVLATDLLDEAPSQVGFLGRWLAAKSPNPPLPATVSAGGREDFLWLGAGLWRDPATRENLFAFARRHDLAVVLVKSRSIGERLEETLGPLLAEASEFDLEVWLNVGMLSELPAADFVSDAAAREAHLDWLRTAARLHGKWFDSGRFVLWQEAPVMGKWTESGEWNRAAVDNLLAHGPEIFAAQKRAIADGNDALDVGLFVHFPYIVDSKQPEVFEKLAARLRQRGADPDFAFVDFYRGWYEKDVGPGPANAAVHSLISNAGTALDDRPVFYLGQSHTINPNHTPSKQAIWMNLRTSIDAGAAGVGWYARNRYVPTEVGFDPFLPNVAGAEVASEAVNTVTVARDRFLHAWLATLSRSVGFDAEEAFDLWLVGDDLGFRDHRLSIRTAAGEWEYVGDFGGYVDGDFPDSSAVTRRATIFRALDRSHFLRDGSLECRVETAAGSSGADLQAALAMPCEPAAYVSEQDAAALALGQRSLDAFSLGRTDERVALRPGERSRLSVPAATKNPQPLQGLRHPESVETLDRLAAFEARDRFDPSATFDLWVAGNGLDRSSRLPSLVDRNGTAMPPADVAAAVTSAESLSLCLGLDRERFLGGEGLRLARGTHPSVEACYAMPYAGTVAFRPVSQAATLLADQPTEVETFSIDAASPD